MFDFFQALSDFLKSDLAESYGWTIFAMIVVCMILSGFLVWLVMDKWTLPSKLVELKNRVVRMEEIEKKNEELEKQNGELIRQNEDLKREIQSNKFIESIKNKDDFEDKAVDAFARKKKKKPKEEP